MTTPADLSALAEPSLAPVTEAFLTVLGRGGLTEFPLTGLDRVGVPVWAAWWSDPSWPPAGAGSGGIGYGPTEQRARVGALGELIEHVCALRSIRAAPRVEGSLAELRRGGGGEAAIDPRLLCMPAGVEFTDERVLQWLPMRRLHDDVEVLVPAELVASSPEELPGAGPPGGWLTGPISNGLGAGSSLEQATAHAILEVLQRDGNGLAFRALDAGMVLDLDGVQDPATLDALGRLAAAGVQVQAKLAATDLGLPNIYVVGAAPDDDILSATACGEAVHPDREVALRKAVLEFANARARKQFMHGPLDRVLQIAPAGYDAVIAAMDPMREEPRVLAAMLQWLRLPHDAWRPLVEEVVLRRATTVPFSTLPTVTLPASRQGAASSLLADLLGRLRAEGYDVLVADTSPPGRAGVHAVKVVIPGLEVETVAYGRIGERNAHRLIDAGRDDLVRVGPQPAGWSRIHLTPDGVQRLGGPAWLDRRALGAVAGALLPLYREPSRHTAQKVLAASTTTP